MNGGNNADTFTFAAAFGADTITGFDANPAGTGNTAGQDRLDISALGITAATFAANVTIAAGPLVAGLAAAARSSPLSAAGRSR